jgi:hypothetical protein
MDSGVSYVDVDSTNVHSVGYSNGTLFVRFKDKKTGEICARYTYADVPESLFRTMPLTHTGTWLCRNVKGVFKHAPF